MPSSSCRARGFLARQSTCFYCSGKAGWKANFSSTPPPRLLPPLICQARKGAPVCGGAAGPRQAPHPSLGCRRRWQPPDSAPRTPLPAGSPAPSSPPSAVARAAAALPGNVNKPQGRRGDAREEWNAVSRATGGLFVLGQPGGHVVARGAAGPRPPPGIPRPASAARGPQQPASAPPREPRRTPGGSQWSLPAQGQSTSACALLGGGAPSSRLDCGFPGVAAGTLTRRAARLRDSAPACAPAGTAPLCPPAR